MTTTRTTPAPTAPTEPLEHDVSITLVVGTLSRSAEVRVLPSGDTVVALELTTRRADGGAESMPVAWPDAPPWAGRLEAGERVIVVGRVRRRFYRAGGATVSRTEIVADRVAPTRQRRRARALADRARAVVDDALVGPVPPTPELDARSARATTAKGGDGVRAESAARLR